MFAGVVALGQMHSIRKGNIVDFPMLENASLAGEVEQKSLGDAVFVNTEPTQFVVRGAQYLVSGEISIYNRPEIFAELEMTVTGRSECGDAELVLLGYEKWGAQLPEHLVGDFAFVIYDESREQALAVRDHLGVKQLYYRLNASQNRFEFSGQLAVLAAGYVTVDDLSIAFMVDYLYGRHPAPSSTMYTGIQQVPPASTLLFDKNGAHTRQFWFPRIGTNSPGHRNRDYGAEFRTLLGEVIATRLPESGKSGLLFSGGLDSTALLYTLLPLCRQTGKELLLFSHVAQSVSARGKEGDARYIDIALQDAGLSTHYCTDDDSKLRRSDLDGYFSRRWMFAWTPFLNRSFPLQRLIARQQIDRVFSGLGGDETVSLEPRWHFVSSFCLGRWREMVVELSQRRGVEGVSWWRVLWRRLIYPFLPAIIQQVYFHWRHGNDERNIPEVFVHSNVLLTHGGGARKRSGGSGWRNFFDPRADIVEVLTSDYFSSSLNMVGANEEIMGCRYNFPFLDKRIIEFCLMLPGEEFIKEDVPRVFIRNAMKGLVPEEIRQRRDKSLLGPLDIEMVYANRELFEEIIAADSDLAWKILDREAVRSALSQLFTSRKDDRKSRELGTQLGKCLNVAAFLQWFEKKAKPSIGAGVAT